MAQTATKTEINAVPVAPRKDFEIKPSAFTWDFQGNNTGKAFVRLPKGFEWADMNLPDSFKRVQQNPRTALVMGDELRGLSYDETWLGEGTVSYADHERVYFAGLKRIDLNQRGTTVATADHVVRWTRDGATQSVGYAVIRLEDGKVVAGPFNRIEAASAAMPRAA